MYVFTMILLRDEMAKKKEKKTNDGDSTGGASWYWDALLWLGS